MAGSYPTTHCRDDRTGLTMLECSSSGDLPANGPSPSASARWPHPATTATFPGWLWLPMSSLGSVMEVRHLCGSRIVGSGSGRVRGRGRAIRGYEAEEREARPRGRLRAGQEGDRAERLHVGGRLRRSSAMSFVMDLLS